MKPRRQSRPEHRKTSTRRAARQAPPFWKTSTFLWSLAAGVGVWAAFPPLGYWPLAWIAPLGWVRVVQQPQLQGRRPYLVLYASAYLHWFVMTQWVRLPHISAGVGWFFLAGYLACYLVGFFALARTLIHKASFPRELAVPLAWVAMEMARSNLFTGFSLALLAHSQVSLTPILQIASATGAYGVSFVVMLVAASIDRALWPEQNGKRLPRFAGLGLSAILVVLLIMLGTTSLSSGRNEATSATAKVAIIQGDLDTEFGDNQARELEAFDHYVEMTVETTSRHAIDLVVWPESMFQRYSIIECDETLANQRPQPDLPSWEEYALRLRLHASEVLRQFGTTSLLGTHTLKVQKPLQRFNTAALYDENGGLLDVYHKMHPVMFGEYIPLGNIFPWLYNFTPMRGVGGLTPGTSPRAFEVAGVRFVPNICFENMVPNLIRSQLRELDRHGQSCDVLVTLTNDGWFWGSSLLDHHLACGVFRAIENRRPLLIAANTGFSAHIDAQGRVLQRGPRRAREVLLADVHRSESGLSFYTRFGDCFGWVCCGVCVLGLLWIRVRGVA